MYPCFMSMMYALSILVSLKIGLGNLRNLAANPGASWITC
jgi:hypothetical protein